jgi:hypothetical protein
MMMMMMMMMNGGGVQQATRWYCAAFTCVRSGQGHLRRAHLMLQSCMPGQTVSTQTFQSKSTTTKEGIIFMFFVFFCKNLNIYISL